MTPLLEGDLFWHYFDKKRPAIVLRHQGDNVAVVSGRGKASPTPESTPDLVIEPDSVDGLRLGLSKRTHFRKTEVRVVRPPETADHRGRATELTFASLRVVIAHRARPTAMVVQRSSDKAVKDSGAFFDKTPATPGE